ncbi:F-box/kelch-repeat protein At3g23880-like [Silene latifolia]|uniref:F-box/kelch-repeat protein At3g23880-like n=1 Tax=Silene latifolia TaxID=37657 RepID=UPI003D76DE3C
MGDESGGPTNIPEEVVSEILCYLPVKSLIRFTIVCKSWFRLIRNNHRFAMKNYLIRTTSSSKVLDNVDYMFSSIRKSGNPCLYSFTKANSFRFSTKFECLPDLSIGISNSCHGIICFHLWREGEEILLCNPLIQEIVLLPPCPTKTTYNGLKALGFDPIQKDYKVVSIDFLSTDNYHCTVNLYSLRHGHWRNLYVSSSPRCIYGIEGRTSNSNGRMHNWFFSKELESGKIGKALLSFDMVEEVLEELPMPNCEDPHAHDHRLLSSTRWQACLSCFSWHFNGRFIHVWVLKDYIWCKAIVVEFPGYDRELMQPSNFWINDKKLFVSIKKGNIIEVFHYNLVTQQLKNTGRKGHLFSSSGYVESLVSIKHFMSLHNECKHDVDGNQNVDEDATLKQEDNGEYIFREVSRKGVRWSRTLNLIKPSK